jgi:hypothetical protein
MSSGNYFFFDGSSLIAQIGQLQDQDEDFKGYKLDPRLLIQAFFPILQAAGLLVEGYRRAVFYFAKGDTRVTDYLDLPDPTQPGVIRDLEIRFCGRRLPRSTNYENFLKTVPAEFLDRCQKSEKGVDIEICCDALQLAASGQLDRLFLLTNDSDFIPLVRKIKELGANISLLRISDSRLVNRELANACDSYDVLGNQLLHAVFRAPVVVTIKGLTVKNE